MKFISTKNIIEYPWVPTALPRIAKCVYDGVRSNEASYVKIDLSIFLHKFFNSDDCSFSI